MKWDAGHSFLKICGWVLKARLAELNHLFQVSNEVAANLEVGEALMPVLQAAQINGIASVRAVLVPEVSFDDIHASL
jgi:hypothetical protein